MTANHAALLRRVAAEASDQELLTRFAGTHDGEAFAELVRRYGPVVFGVCQRVTRQRQDAEDAFQAVFVILARRANTLQKPDLLGNWLYGVAVRVGRKARRSAGRRRVRETTVAVMPEPVVEPLPPSDLGSVLDEELAALPEWYRDAVLLCDLYGHSRTEAAVRLGIPEGTLSSRLAAGRKKLADRLARRGVTASVAGLAAVTVPTELASAAVSTALLAVNRIPIETAIESLTHNGGPTMTKLFSWAVVTVAAIGVTVSAVMALPEQKPTDPPKGEPMAQEKASGKEAPAKSTVKPKLVRTIDIGSNINSTPIWNPDGTAVGFHSSNLGLRLWDPRTGLAYGVRGGGEFLGFCSGKADLLWHFQKGGAINGTSHLIGSLYADKEATPVDAARFGDSVTLATELDREDGTPAEVILKGKGVLAYRVDMKPNPKAGQPRKSPFGGKGGLPEAQASGLGLRAEPREVPDTIRFRVIDTATGAAGPDIVKYPLGPLFNPRIVNLQGDRFVTAFQTEKSVTIECFALPDGKKLWKQAIEPKGPAMSYMPMTLVVSADGSTLAVKYVRIPDPPEPPDRDVGAGGFGGNPRSAATRESSIQLFNMTSGEPGPKVPDLGLAVVQDVSLSHGGRCLAVTTGDRSAASTVQVWDLQTNKLLKSWTGDAKIGFAPDRPVLAIAEVNSSGPNAGNSGVLGLWDLSPLLK